MAIVSKRCAMHQVNNCEFGFCVDERRLNELHPGRNRPSPTPGALETSWANPWRREVDMAQMGLSK